MRLLYMILAMSAITVQLQAITITVWVHGTYPMLSVLRKSWNPARKLIYVEEGLSLAKDLPKNYYFHELARYLHDQDPVTYNFDHMYTYGWHSSNVRPIQRINEGKKLYDQLTQLLQSYKKDHVEVTVRIVGFSHGGNVILNMIKHLPFKDIRPKIEVVLIATPVQESTRNFINSPYVSKAYSFYSDGDWIQKIDVQRLHKNCPKGAPFLSQRTFQDKDCVQQICLTINGKKIGHTRYRYILKYLPDMLKQIDQLIAQQSSKKVICFDYRIKK